MKQKYNEMKVSEVYYVTMIYAQKRSIYNNRVELNGKLNINPMNSFNIGDVSWSSFYEYVIQTLSLL